jgi:hypothetical protein
MWPSTLRLLLDALLRAVVQRRTPVLIHQLETPPTIMISAYGVSDIVMEGTITDLWRIHRVDNCRDHDLGLLRVSLSISRTFSAPLGHFAGLNVAFKWL